MTDFADQLTIDTPEQVELHFPVASVGSRLLAVLADSFVQGVAALLLAVVVFAIFAAAPGLLQHGAAHAVRGGSAQNWFFAGVILVQFLLVWGYFSLFEAFWNGQTPGKRLLHIRVIGDSGRPVTFWEALARNLLRVIDILPTLYLVGLITMLCNRQSKRLGDLLAGTLVVHESKSMAEPMRSNPSRVLLPAQDGLAAAAFPFDRSRVEQAGGAAPGDALARLGAADLAVLETFFGRHLDLTMEVRHTMALRIAKQLSAKMGWAPTDLEQHPERLLESLLYGLRDR